MFLYCFILVLKKYNLTSGYLWEAKNKNRWPRTDEKWNPLSSSHNSTVHVQLFRPLGLISRVLTVRVTAIIVIAHAELLLVGPSWGRSLHCRACAVTMTTHNCKTRVCVSVSVCIYCTCMCFGGDHRIQTGVNQRLEVESTASKRSPCHFTSNCFREVCWVAFESSKETRANKEKKKKLSRHTPST